MTYADRRGFPIGFVFVAFFALLVGFLALRVIALNQHAIERHGNTAVQSAECMDNNGVAFSMTNPETSRRADVCKDPTSPIWFVVIFCALSGAVITAFKKEKLKSEEQVRNYLGNGGYK